MNVKQKIDLRTSGQFQYNLLVDLKLVDLKFTGLPNHILLTMVCNTCNVGSYVDDSKLYIAFPNKDTSRGLEDLN